MNASLFHAPISEQIWDAKYRLRDENKKPLEADVTETWRRIAKALAQAERPKDQAMWEATFYNALAGFKFLPAGRITAGAGTGRNVTLFNCFVMGTIPDSMGGIFSALREAALTMQQGGGIGYDFSPLRPKGSLVKGVAADASGPLTFMDCWDAMCRTVMSAGSRRGAMMATMRVDHPDIELFIEAKRDPLKLRMFNLSVLITDAFMAAVEADTEFQLVHKQPPGQIDSPVMLMGQDDQEPVYLYRTIRARDLWQKIMRSTYEYAEPGVIFIDRINRANNLRYMEEIAATNPCGEQPLPPYGACLLGSINLPTLIHNAFTSRAGLDRVELENLVATAIRMMDNVVDVSKFPLAAQEDEARKKRRLGLGVTGLADALIMCGLTYGTVEAAQKAALWMALVENAAYRTSIKLAREKGSFPGFNADGILAEGTHASTLPRDIQDGIRGNGLRNALLTSIAPTGTISLYAGNVSSGVEPVFAYAYTRKVLNDDGTKREEAVEDFAYRAYRQHWIASKGGSHEVADQWDDSYLPDYFVSAQTLEPLAHVRMQAAAQKHVDSSISKTINIPVDMPFDDFVGVYQASWDQGCKGCTTYRPNEVTGSILSVAETPAKAEEAPDFVGAFPAATPEPTERPDLSGLKKNEDGSLDFSQIDSDLPDEYRDNESLFLARSREILDGMIERGESKALYALSLSAFKVDKASDIEPSRRRKFIEYLQGWNRAPDEAPTERPGELDGTTYKLKWPGSNHSLYITITDIKENGEVRPFEVFINSKNMEHFAWTVALTRMISAVFRRPHDSRFVVEELKAVFDPKGGAWMNGKFVPSILAAIGGIIEKHMRAIGYIEEPEDDPLKETQAAALRIKAKLDLPGVVTEAQARRIAMLPEMAMPYGQQPAPAMCPACHSSNVKKEAGCFVCKDCGNSNCG